MELDNNKNLYTTSGIKIPELNVQPKSYIDKTIVIYGPTKTGKTVITKNIMKTVHPYIDQILIIAPSEPSNRSYEGYVDSPFIHYKLYTESGNRKDDWKEKAFLFLESIWKRQEMMAAIYTRTNRIEILESLFNKIKSNSSSLLTGTNAHDIINSIKNKLNEAIASINNTDDPGIKDIKIKNMTDKFNEMTVQVYKKYILLDYNNLWILDLNEDERYSLQYIQFNPRLLLIFDDCAAQLKPFFTKEIFRKLFYQNRHSFITLIICCQDDTDLPANLRKNVFINFYTESIVCASNFERISNRYSKNTKDFVAEIIPVVFKGYRKLAYIREDSINFYHATFEYPKTFKFGSLAMQELCTIVQSMGITMDKDNPYYDHFKL